MYSSDGRKRKEYAIAENNGALFYIDNKKKVLLFMGKL